jgi:hypothetical protein
VLRADIDGRSKRSFQHETPDRARAQSRAIRTFAVGGVEHHVFRVSQPNSRRGRSPALWEVLERALCHVEQCDEAAIEDLPAMGDISQFLWPNWCKA